MTRKEKRKKEKKGDRRRKNVREILYTRKIVKRIESEAYIYG